MIPTNDGGLTSVPSINFDDVENDYRQIRIRLEDARTDREIVAVFRHWETLRRLIDGWKNLISLRLRQDTADEARRVAAAHASALTPTFDEYDAKIKRVLLERRSVLEAFLGPHILDRWQVDFDTVAEGVRGDLEAERRLGDEYTIVLGGIRCDFQRERYSLTDMTRFAESDDRAIRREAVMCRWRAAETVGSRLDQIFDELVHRRTFIAKNVGYRSFVEVAYKRLGRTDYDREDVAAFRREILERIVPLCSRLAEGQAQALGVGCLMPWDEQAYDLLFPIRPPSTPNLPEALKEVLRQVHPEMAVFAQEMFERQLLDIEARSNKAGGASCSYLAHLGMPFVYTYPRGTPADVTSLVHEMGHAFQNYLSREQPALEFIIPTAETSEIHSLTLEFLAWPYYERFFEEGAERFRKRHLQNLIGMLPYIAAVDHFQESIYESPELSPSGRHVVWNSFEALYMPWRRHGNVPALVQGARWWLQRHIFREPFYYIDYGLALCCALHF